MYYRTLGKSGLKVSAVGLGCTNIGDLLNAELSLGVIHKALDLGINFFDTADGYGKDGSGERILGETLGARRSDVVLATKFGSPNAMSNPDAMNGGSRRYIMQAVEGSLKRLQTDWIDLLQLHRPDPLTPVEETLRALDDVVRQGKVRYIGCSRFAPWELVEAQWTSKHHHLNAFVSCQEEYSLVQRGPERELIPAMQAYGVGLLPFFPLGSGLLTGKYKRDKALPEGARLTTIKRYAGRYLTDANWAIVGRLDKFCEERGHTLLELAFSWLAAQPIVASVMAGVSRPEQLEANVKAIDWTLTPDDLKEIDRLTKGKE